MLRHLFLLTVLTLEMIPVLLAQPLFASTSSSNNIFSRIMDSAALATTDQWITDPPVAGASAQAGADEGELLACPAWQAPPAASYQSFPDAGLYTFFDWSHVDPKIYPWLSGGHLVFKSPGLGPVVST